MSITTKKCYAIDQITIGLDIYDIVDAIAFIIDVSICASLLYLLTVVFDGFDLNFDKPREFGCGDGNNSEATVILRNTCAIRDTTHPVKFYLIVIIIMQLMAHLAIQSSVNAVHCYSIIWNLLL